jgi:membrane protein required for colicin V production
MTYVDFILLIPLIWFGYQGFRKGLIIEVATLFALIAGIYAGFLFSDPLTLLLGDVFNSDAGYLPIVSFVITFVFVVVLIYLLGKILEKFIDFIALGFINKLAGVLFGVLKGTLIMSIGLSILLNLNVPVISAEKKNDALLYQPIESIASILWKQFENLNEDGIDYQDLKQKAEEVQV